MADRYSKSRRSEIMRIVKSRGTTPELIVARMLRRAGLRYRCNLRIAGIRTDFVLPDHRIVLLIDGCLWHGCTRHRPIPKSNVQFWTEKLQRNRRRDRQNSRDLRAAGWSVVRIWEHTVVRRRRNCVVGIIRRAIARSRRLPFLPPLVR